jgi:hypothetical protein
MEISPTKKSVNSIIESQRKEGEARSLLQDLEKLLSLKRERKLRWVWELLQNAVDCSTKNKVSLSFTLSRDKIVFEHDGGPFQLEDLIALVRKTSTKSVEGLDGKKGKFGTGFVTTHVLNTKVTVSGLLKNEDGCRPFTLQIDRSTDSLPKLMQLLDASFDEIEKINTSQAVSSMDQTNTRYEYVLEDHKFDIAKDGLEELERNLPFTLLINNDLLQCVTITDENNNTSSFALGTTTNLGSEIGFTEVIKTGANRLLVQSGLLFHQKTNLTIAVPALKTTSGLSLNRIGQQAKIFRNFPLIGTETYLFPCFIHSILFQPTEPRDGIRTVKDFEERPDKHADENRGALKLYVESFKKLFADLRIAKINNIHLLAESGVPFDTQNYIAKDWFVLNIQKTIRDFLLTQNLVKTVNQELINIPDAKFIKTPDLESEKEFYSIVSELFPSKCPDENSYQDWKIIIEQDEHSWADGISICIEDIAQDIERKKGIDTLSLHKTDATAWLNKLIAYVLKTGNIELTERYAIYPNQSKQFKTRLELKTDPGFDDKLKIISEGIFRNLYDELILKDIENQEGIQKFDTAEFFSSMNTFIGALDHNKATETQTKAIFELGCYFKEAPAPKRTEWFELTTILLPTLATNKSITTCLGEFNFEPTDKWTLKYVCSLIEKTKSFKTFSETYFNRDSNATYEWLNRFIAFVCRSDEGKDTAFKHSIVLTQDGYFKKYEGNLYRENNPADFEILFKDLIRDYIGKGDPRAYLIDTKITNEYLQAKGVDFLTGQIDKLFSELKIEQAVEEGGKLNPLFHKLNGWYSKEEEKHNPALQSLFPIFKGKRPDLSVRAYGKEMSKIMAEKGMAEITALTKLKLKSNELSQLEHAAELVGGTQVLLSLAQEIHAEAEDIRWRKLVGTAAEMAFKDAMQEFETMFAIENPDIGKDFTIISKETGKEFYIEIKSTVLGAETVTMSALQGLTANQEKNRYALCVITRPSNTLVDTEYFLQNVKFVTNIGDLIGDKVATINNELKELSELEAGEVNVAMDNKAFSVYISKTIWEKGIGFDQFVTFIKTHLSAEC